MLHILYFVCFSDIEMQKKEVQNTNSEMKQMI